MNSNYRNLKDYLISRHRETSNSTMILQSTQPSIQVSAPALVVNSTTNDININNINIVLCVVTVVTVVFFLVFFPLYFRYHKKKAIITGKKVQFETYAFTEESITNVVI
jgi:hypothetical protein